jgi:phage shock protein A
MKKLFEFIKGLFVKLDVLEEKVEKIVDDSKLLSAEQKAKVKKGLNDFDKFEENIEDVVEEAEVAAAKVEKAVKSKNLVDAAAAVESVKNVAKEAKEVGEDVKNVTKKVKEVKTSIKPKKAQ